MNFRNKSKSIKSKLLILPVTLIVISILGILLAVWFKTNSNMMAEMEAQSDYLLHNVSARLTDYDQDDQEAYQKILEEFESQPNVEYIDFINDEYITDASSNLNDLSGDMSQNESVVSAINNNSISTRDTNLENGTEIFEMIYPVIEEDTTIGALRVGFNVDGIGPVIMDTVKNVAIIGFLAIALLVFVLYKFSSEVIDIIGRLQYDMELMADGDFSLDVREEMTTREDEFGEIARADMQMKASIRDILTNVTSRAEVVAAHSEELTATANQSAMASDELASVVQEVAATSSSQANDVENGAYTVQQLERIMGINAEHMTNLNSATDEVDTLKDEGVELIRDLVDKTEETREAIREIGTVIEDTNTSADSIVRAIEMIKSISDQTNLLALNASIEAARAGEAGAGFAVVAEEIRTLAEDSSNFTGEIEEIVNDLTVKITSAVDTMGTVDEMIDLQGDSVDRTDAKFEGISLSLEEIQTAIQEVNSSSEEMAEQENELRDLLENLAAVAEENAAGSEEASASVEEQTAVMAEISNASEELAETAEELNNAVSIFTI